MVAQVDIVNRALQSFGSRTTVTAAELAANGSNEAIQANLIYAPFRRRLLRMAPWNCAFNTAALTLITAVPGTPENTSPATAIWQKGQPAPPWAYEYQYPVDCLRATWVTPQSATGFASGIPITTAVTGGSPSFWQGPPVKFSVGVDQFFSVTGVTITNGGTGYSLNDILSTPAASAGAAPFGAPAQYQVTSVGGGGVITGLSVINQILDAATPTSGSFFQIAGIGSGVTGGTGTGAVISPSGVTTLGDQRVIFTNQEFAILNYIRDVTNENIFDIDFQEAFAQILGSRLCIALTGDKSLANMKVAETNAMIIHARGDDANEGFKVNDVLPDWIRVRGINFTEDYSGPYDTGYNWGSIWPGYT